MAAIADKLKNPNAGIGAAVNLIEQEIVAHATSGHFNEALVGSGIAKVRVRLKSLDEYVFELIDFARALRLTFASSSSTTKTCSRGALKTNLKH